jgi:hypothetical protein
MVLDCFDFGGNVRRRVEVDTMIGTIFDCLNWELVLPLFVIPCTRLE